MPAAAAPHPTGGHVIHVVVLGGPFLPRGFERFREGADELITQFHRRDLERVLQRPVVVRRVFPLAGPEQERDQFHLDGSDELRIAFRLRALLLAFALAFGASGGRRWGNGAVSRANAPRGTSWGRSDRGRLGDQARPQGREVVLRGRPGRLGRGWRRHGHGRRRLVRGDRLSFLRNRHGRHGKARYRPWRGRGRHRRLRRSSGRHHLRRHALLGHRWLRRICREARLGLARVGLGRVGLALWRAGIGGTLRVRCGRITGLLRVAARAPRGGRRRVLARRRPRLPRGRLAGDRGRVGPLDGGDRPLLVRWDIGSRGALEHGLTASQQVQEAGFVDVEVAGEARVDAGGEHELAALEFPEEIEGLTRTADPAAGGVRQRTALEGVDPLTAGLSELEYARLAVVHNLIEKPKQPDAIDRAIRRCLGLGARLPFALGEELHTAVTGEGTPSLPV